MNWEKAIYALAEEIVNRVKHDHQEMWGYKENDETDLDLEFPDCAKKEIEIDGVKHEMKIYCILDGKLPASLQKVE